MKKLLFRSALLLLALTILMGAVSCANKGKTLLSLEKDGIEVTFSVNAYELMLGRTKATLDSIQNVNDADFWNSWIGSPAKTMDEHYRENILESCKTSLIALYLFEKEGLSLSESDEEEIEMLMDELIKTDGDGSKTKLNSVLATHGVNYNILKDIYTMEAKIQKLQLHLYGEDGKLIGDDIKTSFLKENYVHYKQIYLPFSKFVYEKDKNNDEIYYKYESDGKTLGKHISYDTGNGAFKSDEKDANGDTVYYTDSTKAHISYDKVNGGRMRATKTDGSYQTEVRTKEELEALKAEKDSLLALFSTSTTTTFDEKIEEIRYKYGLDAEQNTDGYYIRRMDYSQYGTSYAYLADTIEKCDKMKNGEVAVVESASGYHLIQKCEFTEKAYDIEANKEGWFENFNELLINDLFSELCQKYIGDVVVDEEVLALAPSMKEVAACYFY